MKPTISKPFKSNDRTFDKVYNAFDKRDYFNSQGLAKVQIGNFERALKKNDKGAQQVLDLFKGDVKKAKDYITQVISDRNKERAFNNYKALKSAVDSIQKGKPNVGAVDYVKRIIHNSSQKYSIALYSTLRNKKFTKWKDVHNDVDDLIGESVNEGKEPEVISQLRDIVKGKQNKKIKDPKSGKMMRVDLYSASAITKVYDAINKSNKDKFGKLSLPKMVNVAFSVIKKESVNEGKFKPSQVRSAISRVKKQLMRKWKQKGGYENFGQKELSQMRDKFDYNPYGSSDERQIAKMLDGFDNWAMNYDGNMREGIEPQIKKIAYYTGTRPEAVEDFVSKYALNFTKLLKYVQKGGLPQRMELVAALAGRPNNPKQKKIIKQFQESEDGVPQGYNPMVESKTKESKIIQKIYQYSKNEKKFYDELAKHEVRIGQRDYAKFIIMALKGFGINPREFKRIPDAEEKLYQTVSK